MLQERKRKALDFMEKEISEENEEGAEKLLILMEGIKMGLDLAKEDQKAAG